MSAKKSFIDCYLENDGDFKKALSESEGFQLAFDDTASNSIGYSGNVYLFRLEGFDYYKIGISKNIKNRLLTINTGSPFLIECIYYVGTKDCERVEKYLHDKYSHRNVRNEWFLFATTEIKSVIGEMNAYAETVNDLIADEQ